MAEAIVSRRDIGHLSQAIVAARQANPRLLEFTAQPLAPVDAEKTATWKSKVRSEAETRWCLPPQNARAVRISFPCGDTRPRVSLRCGRASRVLHLRQTALHVAAWLIVGEFQHR